MTLSDGTKTLLKTVKYFLQIPTQSAVYAHAPYATATVLFPIAQVSNSTDSPLSLTHHALIMQSDLPLTDICTHSLPDFNVLLQQDKHLSPEKKATSWVLDKKTASVIYQIYGTSQVIK